MKRLLIISAALSALLFLSCSDTIENSMFDKEIELIPDTNPRWNQSKWDEARFGK